MPESRHRWGFFVSLWIAVAASACSSGTQPAQDTGVDQQKVDSGPTYNDTCTFAKDGVCDEPVNCALGTDDTDCTAACAAGTTPHLLGAACGLRNPPVDPPIDPSIGSGGTLHLTGNRDGYIKVPSGADSSKLVDRHYRIFVPPSYDPARPTPLVLHMPGHRVTMHILPPIIYLHHTADLNNFILVYLEQEIRSDIRYAWWTDWDWKNKPNDNPDLYFLRAIIKKLQEDYNIDRTRIFATGQSRGAAMSIIAAFEMPDLIAGACSESGFTEYSYHLRIDAYNGRHVPLFFVHGVQDNDIPVTCKLSNCGIEASDAMATRIRAKGWTDAEFTYLRLERVGHAWEPQYDQQMWDFLSSQPLPK